MRDYTPADRAARTCCAWVADSVLETICGTTYSCFSCDCIIERIAVRSTCRLLHDPLILSSRRISSRSRLGSTYMNIISGPLRSIYSDASMVQLVQCFSNCGARLARRRVIPTRETRAC
ncbi:hypothetical protein TNCV_1130111 [Trichonephila clavipes]|nr:hypothetical protein TNCV_1130111 [Trichonephila clavipes]